MRAACQAGAAKRCTKCGLTSPLESYYRDERMPDGRRSACRACSRAPEQTNYTRRGPCRHCGRLLVLQAWRLCSSCYRQVAVRHLYRHVKDAPAPPEGGLSRPGEPTGHTPGTEEKIVTLSERLHRGEPLHHPKDARPNLR